MDERVLTARALAAERGDGLINVVCGESDGEPAAALRDAGFARTVDVHQLPSS